MLTTDVTAIFEAIPWGEFLSAAFGAFGGAWCAYQFEKRKARSDREEARYAAIAEALMTLCYNVNSVEQLRRGWEKWRDLPDREPKIKYFKMVSNPTPLKLDGLAFLVTIGGEQVMLDLYISDSLYRNAFDAVETRNAFLREVQGSRKPTNDPVEGFVIEVDPIALKLLKDSTDSVYGAIDRALPHMVKAAKDLRALAMKALPGRPFPRFEIQAQAKSDTPPISSSSANQ